MHTYGRAFVNRDVCTGITYVTLSLVFKGKIKEGSGNSQLYYVVYIHIPHVCVYISNNVYHRVLHHHHYIYWYN